MNGEVGRNVGKIQCPMLGQVEWLVLSADNGAKLKRIQRQPTSSH